MRIAVPYEDGKVFGHFGHTERFCIYDIEDQEIRLKTTVNTDGSGHGALAGMLAKLKVDLLICGGIGAGAKRALEEADIRLCAGVQGDADQAVQAFVKGTLVYNNQATCNHHHEGGDCGGHHEGSHSCGGHCGEH